MARIRQRIEKRALLAMIRLGMHGVRHDACGDNCLPRTINLVPQAAASCEPNWTADTSGVPCSPACEAAMRELIVRLQRQYDIVVAERGPARDRRDELRPKAKETRSLWHSLRAVRVLVPDFLMP